MNGEDEEEPEAATVLVDLLLELLHRPSAFVKSVAQTVFTGFADEIGEQAMELLLEVRFACSACGPQALIPTVAANPT